MGAQEISVPPALGRVDSLTTYGEGWDWFDRLIESVDLRPEDGARRVEPFGIARPSGQPVIGGGQPAAHLMGCRRTSG